MKRAQFEKITSDLKKKMVFLSGPRQVGKTWLANTIATQYANPIYLNYDRLEDRGIIKQESWPQKTNLLILDEIHKMENWKGYIKGVFDVREPNLHILVTGSARLEIYRQMGDSLAGRYFPHRLLPYSLAEARQTKMNTNINIDLLIERSGFPEPLLAENTVSADRWRMQYSDSLIRTDVLDFERIHDFRAIQLVLELLRRRVGSPVSYTSIAEDAQISPTTVKKYIAIFESLYIVFILTPFSKNIARSLVKEPKIYFFDTGMVNGDEGTKFENMAAIALLKHVYGLEDYTGKKHRLHYLRTKDGEEVDFCLTREGALLQMIEVKVQAEKIPPALLKFNRRYDIPAVLLVKELKREQDKDDVAIRKASAFLSDLYL